MDDNDRFYVCDRLNYRIQRYLSGATNGTTVAGASAGVNASSIDHVQYLALDKLGNMYVTGNIRDDVLKIPFNSLIATTVAGGNTSGTTNNLLSNPTDMVVDNDFNLYVVDASNRRIMKWAPNATIGIVVISNLPSSRVVGILFARNSTNAFYLSDEINDCIYLWTAGLSSPDITLSQVSSAQSTLNTPHGIIHDIYYNLYVVDSNNNRVVLYCANSTVGYPIIGESGSTPALSSPLDIAFDSNFNLYVVLRIDKVIKYSRF